MIPEYADRCRAALVKLSNYFNGNKSQIAAACGVSRNSVTYWFRKGYIGRGSAMLIDANPKIPMSKEELRPDIHVWRIYRKPELKQDA